jgi:hypothetical protein
VRDLVATVPFGGPDVRVVNVSLVHDREKMLGLLVQKGDRR